ncbi:histidine phosphatase family protein [Pseudocolwellia sp. HL-MZ19]|uniref:histidine phosphatase family protein n=1 Tax=unclassified Pseudocolwellia TaxID=2848178 RepID=UPI003CF0459A
MKYLFLLLMLSYQCAAANTHHIFLTTQAETEHKSINPALSQCGRLRAHQLSTLLSYSNIERVYSTTERSAMETANPLAKLNGIPVKIFTDNLLDSLAVTVMKESKNVLIVAEQEAVKFLVEFISKHKIHPPENNNHKILYQISIIDDQKMITILKQPLEC